jgi:hypothetical protein
MNGLTDGEFWRWEGIKLTLQNGAENPADLMLNRQCCARRRVVGKTGQKAMMPLV